MFPLSCAAAHVTTKTPRSSFQLPRGDWHDDRLMEIKPLDSGLFSGEWRLDDGRVILGECQMTKSRRELRAAQHSGLFQITVISLLSWVT